MDPITEGFLEAIKMLITFDPEIWGIIFLSIRVSGTSTLIAALIGLPIGTYLGLKEFAGKKILGNLINTFMGFPPVVMGLILYLLLSASGPFGSLGLLYTTTAMIIAQTLLAIPIIMGTSMAAIENIGPDVKETVVAMGASGYQYGITLIEEAKRPIIAGLLVAFGQSISEVGAVMIVGGNIRWHTRVFTTAIVLETRTGEFGKAIALGLILIVIAFTINYYLTHLQYGDKR